MITNKIVVGVVAKLMCNQVLALNRRVTTVYSSVFGISENF